MLYKVDALIGGTVSQSIEVIGYDAKQASSADNDASYRWNTKLVAHYFCPVCGCGTFTDSPAFKPDGSWDKHTRRIGVNARLFDNFDTVDAPVVVIDGKNLWFPRKVSTPC